MARFRNIVSLPVNLGQAGVWFGWVMALVSTLSFSIAIPIVKGAIIAGMDPTTLLAARLLIATLLLGISIVLTSPRRLRMDRRGALISMFAGFIVGVGMLSIFWALTRIDASVASMILSLTPLAVLTLLALRGEKFTIRHILRLLLGLVGAYFLIGLNNISGSRIDWLGIGLAAVTITAVATQLVVIQWFLQGYEAQTVTFYVVANMAVVAIGFWLIQGAPWQNPGWSGWMAIGALAVISTYLARVTLFAAIRHLGSGQVALLYPFEMLLTVFWSMLFLNERLTMGQWLGGTFILLSAFLAIDRLRWAQWRPRWRIWTRP